MILAIVGSRTFTDYELLEREVLKRWTKIDKIHTGGRRVKAMNRWMERPQDGACWEAWKFAEKFQIPIRFFLPHWISTINGGWYPNRSKFFLGQCTDAIAFWDGKSPGTRGEIKELKRLGIFKEENEENIIRFNK
jgi:hypothetical protein